MILILCKLFGYTKKLIFKILTDLIYITGLPFWSMKYFTQQDPIHHNILLCLLLPLTLGNKCTMDYM